MNEVRIFIELQGNNDGTISFTNGGGCCNNGQMKSFNSIKDAITDLNERVAVEYETMCKNKMEKKDGCNFRKTCKGCCPPIGICNKPWMD